MAAQGGPAVDLRDDRQVRSIFFNMLVDWNGSDLKSVYEPLSDQIGYFLTAALVLVACVALYYLYLKWNRERRETPIPYKVIQPPKFLAEKSEKEEGDKKRIVAIFGSTGFVGSHIAETLIATGRYRVYLMGRRFSSRKILPGADAVFQVDMMDYKSLVSALQGVDSVINSAAVPPNVFTTDDDLWRLNVTGGENILAASKEAGVKNFIQISGVGLTNIPSGSLKVIINGLTTLQEYVLKAKEMNTCVMCFSQIYGVRSSFWDMILSGKMSSFPKTNVRATFTPVEFVADSVVRAEEKLAQKDDKVVGRILKLGGYPSSFKEFTDLDEWGCKISDSPLWVLKCLARINYTIGRLSGWAPMGSELCPGICSFFEAVEEEVDNSVIEEVLGIGSVPHIKDGVRKMVARYNEMNNNTKEKKEQ